TEPHSVVAVEYRYIKAPAKIAQQLFVEFMEDHHLRRTAQKWIVPDKITAEPDINAIDDHDVGRRSFNRVRCVRIRGDQGADLIGPPWQQDQQRKPDAQ